MSLLDPKQIRGGVPDGGNISFNITAGETLSGQSVVMINGGVAKYYDPTDTNNLGKTIGLTNAGVLIGGVVHVIMQGIITSVGWGLLVDSVYYAGINGSITTTVPSPPFIQQRVGVAISSDSLKIQFSEPIIII